MLVRSTQVQTLQAEDCRRVLGELMPLVGNYDWAWKLLRKMEQRGGRWPHKTHSILKRLFNRRKPLFIGTTTNGVKFMGDRRDRYARGTAINPDAEDATCTVIAGALGQRGGAYFDVGTNMGVVAALVAREMPETQVYAFEPLPETVRRCAATFALNGLSNATLFPIAIGDEDTEISFFSAEGKSEAASANPVIGGYRWQETKVACHKLDTIIDQLSGERAGVLKIDVEGHEPKAVRGAEALIRRDHPTILYEYHFEIAPDLGWTAEDVGNQIQALNRYELACLQGVQRVPFPPQREMGVAVNVICEPA